MAINIDTLVHNEFGRSATDQLEKILSKPSDQIKTGVECAVSEVLDSLSLMARDESGRQAIYEAARYCDDGLIDEPAIFFAGKDQQAAVATSNNAIGSLMGTGKRDAISEAVRSASKLSTTDADTITGYVAPGVLAVMKRQLLNGAVLDNSDGIGQMLLGETTTATAGGAAASVDHSVPKNAVRQTTTTLGNTGSSANVSSAANVAGGAGVGAGATAAAAVGHDNGADLSWLFRWALPFLLLGGLVLAGLRNCGPADLDTVSVAEPVVIDRTEEIAGLTAERDEALADSTAAMTEVDRLKGELETASVPVVVDTTELDAANAEILSLKDQLAAVPAPVEVDTGPLDAANAEILSLKDQLAAVPAPVEVDTGPLDAANAEIVSLKEQLAAVPEPVEIDTGPLDAANAEIASLKTELANVPAPVDNSAQIMGLQQLVDDGGIKFGQLESELGAVRSNRDELEASIAELKVQKTAAEDNLVTATADLEAKLAEADGVTANLTGEVEGLKQSIADLEAERDQLTADLEGLAAERDALTGEIDSLKGELATVSGERDALTGEIEGLKGEVATVTGERDNLNDSVAELTAARDEAMKATEAETAKLGALDSKVGVLNTKLGGLASNFAVVTDEAKGLKGDVKTLEGKVKSLDSDLKSADSALQKQKEATSTVEGERDEALSQIEGLQQELGVAVDDAAAQYEALDASKTDILALQKTVVIEEDKNQGLTAELAKMTEGRDEAIATVSDLEAQLEALQAQSSVLASDKQGLENAIAETEAEIQARKDAVNSVSVTLAEELATAGLVDVAVQPINDSQAVGITLGSSQLYRVGSASLSPEGSDVLETVGEIIGQYSSDWRIDVEGHTDGQPIGGSLREKFASNWELSVARAASAVRYLQFKTGLPAENMSVRGFGEYKPVATNETREGREANRRIEVILRK